VIGHVKTAAEIAELLIRGWCAIADRRDKASERERKIRELEQENARLREKAERKARKGRK
jgi:hypothetical protein